MTADGEKSAPPLFVLHEHASSVLCCGFYPSSTYERERSSWFLSGDVDGTVIVWNLLTRRPLTAFAAAEEARRQLSESLRQASCAGGGADDSQGTPSSSTSFAALGPHSRSVLSVGFIPASASSLLASSLLASQKEVSVPSQETADSVVPEKPSGGAGQEVALAALAPGALPVPASHLVRPQRQRFRLSRRPVPRSSDNAHSSSATGSASDEKPLLEAPPLASSMCFYTHCRDQRVYVWSFSTSTVTLRLMAALTAPQHGFCPAESASIVENAVVKTFLAVPHDTNGEVSVWEMQWKPAVWSRKSDLESHNSLTEESCIKADDAGGKGEDKSDREEDEEEVDVTGMSPMDALIARAAAQERRDAKKRSAHFGDSMAEHPVEGSGSSSSAATVIKRTQRSSFLCFVAPFATSRECGFSVRLLCTFTACPRFKGGTIMRLTMCGDAQHITVAFESGHVVLVRFRSDALNANGAAELNVEERAFLKQHETPSNVPTLRCVVRAFAESALACWWSGRRVLACSAEGALHCYEVALASTDVARDAQPCAVNAPLQLQLVWSSALRRGIGSVCLQANFVIAGCWDSTLRLYDARDGHLVSILSYQREVINEVTVAPPAIARAAAFGFDTRHPRCYAPQPEHLRIAGTRGQLLDASAGPGNVEGKGIALAEPPALRTCGPHEEEELVYLFGSASKDGSVAVWRVDMQLVAEKAAMQQLML